MSTACPPRDTEGTLLQKVRALLAQSPHTDLEIYTATGLKPSWLDTVRRGVIKDPGVNRVQKLYEYLTSAPLKV